MANYGYSTGSGVSRPFTHIPKVFVPPNLPPKVKQGIDNVWASYSGFPHMPVKAPDQRPGRHFLDNFIRSSVISEWQDGNLGDINSRDLSTFTPGVNRLVDVIFVGYTSVPGWENLEGDDLAKREYERGLRRWYRDTYMEDHKLLAQRQLRRWIEEGGFNKESDRDSMSDGF